MKKSIILMSYILVTIMLLIFSIFFDVILPNKNSNFDFNSILGIMSYILIYLIFVRLDKLNTNKYSSLIRQTNIILLILSIIGWINSRSEYSISLNDFQLLYFLVATIFIIYKMIKISKSINSN